jgi:hypothetical protein
VLVCLQVFLSLTLSMNSPQTMVAACLADCALHLFACGVQQCQQWGMAWMEEKAPGTGYVFQDIFPNLAQSWIGALHATRHVER